MKIITSALVSKVQTSFVLSKGLRFGFAENQKKIVDRAKLHVRNSDTFELKLQQYDPQSRKYEPVNIQMRVHSTLRELTDKLKVDLDISFTALSQEMIIISPHTPLLALLNRSFVLIAEGVQLKVEGQFLHPDINESRQQDQEQLQKNLRELELPVIAQMEIQAFMKRVDIWLDAKYGTIQKNPKLRIKSKQVQDILVQAIMDPQYRWADLSKIQNQWQEKYWQLLELREKKQKAEQLCIKMARRKMSVGLGLLAANVGFIWSGTYVFFSWDIIQPIAYFTSSLAGIVLFGQVLKLRKPFSLQNYKNYLIEAHLPEACEKVGLNLSDLKQKQFELQLIQATMKDYLITKL